MPDPFWTIRAACRGLDPKIFMGYDNEITPARKTREARAKAICRGCPVRESCLEFALLTGQPGIWGGTDEVERRRLLGQRKPRRQL